MSRWARVRTLWDRFGPRAGDVGSVALALVASLAESLARRDEGAAAWAPVLVVGVVAAASLWWRRSHPVSVTVVGMAAYGVTNVPVTLALGLFSLAVRRRDRVLAAVTAAAALTFAVVAGRGTSEGWPTLAVLGLIEAGLSAAAGAYVGTRRDLVDALRERAARAEEEQDRHAEQARAGERARIAREMHDVLAHKVSLIAMHAGALEVRAAPSVDQVHETALLIRTTAAGAMDDLREVLGVLRRGAGAEGTDLAPPPRRADIERLVDASRAAGVCAELRMEVAELPDALARTAHRVVQEGLTNVHKHARGAPTCVAITGDEAAGATIEVVNGRPPPSSALVPGSGAGLIGLGERLALLGGCLEAGTGPDGGWRLVAWLPWAAPATGARGAP